MAAAWCAQGISPCEASTVQIEDNEAFVLLKWMLWGLATVAVGLLVLAALI